MTLQESSLNNEDLALTSIFDSAALLESAKDLAQSQLQVFAQSQDFNDRIASAFGQGRDVNKLRDIWLTGKISFPAIEIRSKSDLGGAYGAFSQETGKIYLAQQLINTNSKALISSVLLEEYGHFVDTQVNVVDSAGDEGEIFSWIVQGKVFEPEQLRELMSQDDSAIINLDGVLTLIEQVSISGSGGEGGTTRTITLPALPQGQSSKGSITVKWSYEHFSIPDQFAISYEGKDIFTTGGLVPGRNSGTRTIPRGNSNEVIVKVTAPTSGTAWNFTASAEPVTESADLELNKIVVGSDPITSSNFTYRLSVNNKGTSLSRGVVLKDSLPPEVTFVSASAAPSQQTGSDLTFNLGEVAPGETKTVDITVKAPATALTC